MLHEIVEPAVHEQKLNFLRAHATELNRRIISLMESSDRGFPTHINLQVRTQLPQPDDSRAQQLEKQNKLLYQELAEKDRVIEALRRENAEAIENYEELKKLHQQKIAAVSSRPAAMVRPALHQKIAYKQAPSPIKIHDTLM
ncbi:unnamed protein product [Enterobius vermicularis]|uniref:Dystrobrevin alpha n=1 Tax=Enterobius vermicularis TaxID=51028 RepID=A0A0N4V259_ENTVE|nr:unnamed protein product [Enterobius vermicularis]